MLKHAPYFAPTDINIGMDKTGNFNWITPEGRFGFIFNSTELTDVEKSVLMSEYELT